MNASLIPTRPLGDVAKVISGYAFKSAEFGEKGVPVIKIKNIRVGTVDLGDAAYVDERFLELDSKYHVNPGDLLISLTGSHPNQPNSVVGRVARMGNHQSRCLLNQRAGKIYYRKGAEGDLGYLFYVLSSPKFRNAVAMLANGAASQANVSPTQVEGLEIPLPDLPTQRKIAGILSAYDDLIENNLRRIKILEQMAQSLYREWFVHFRFPGHEAAKSSDTSSGEFPEGWRTSLEEHIDYKEGPGLRKWQYRNEGIPFLNIRTLGDNDIDLSKTQFLDPEEVESKYQHFLLKKFDHVVSSSGTIGRVVTVRPEHLPLMLNTSIIRMRPKGGQVGLWQLKHFLLSEDFQNQAIAFATGAAQPNFGPSHLKQMKITAPPANVSEEYERVVTPLEEAIHNLLAKNQNLRKTRDLLLPKLLT